MYVPWLPADNLKKTKELHMALTKTQVSRLYITLFGRASEGEGNAYWQTAGTDPDMASTADKMLQTEAATDFFGDSLNQDHAFIEHIYQNALDMPDLRMNAVVMETGSAGNKTVIVSA